jgi:hypothetical protein
MRTGATDTAASRQQQADSSGRQIKNQQAPDIADIRKIDKHEKITENIIRTSSSPNPHGEVEYLS